MIRLRDIPKMNYTLNKVYERVTEKLRPTPINEPFTAVGIEVTTYCNSHCDFCSHETTIGKFRPMGHMPLDMAERSMNYLKRVDGGRILKFSPVGLGETLMYPHLPEVMRMAKDKFPEAQTFANTNCISLRGKVAEDLIDADMDVIVFSMCFVGEKDYQRRLHTNYYGQVSENIKNFLKMKGDRRPSVKIHVFNLPENKRLMWKWVAKWSPLLNDNDHLSVYPYVELVNTEENRNPDNFPCPEIKNYGSVMIDLQGNLTPCCSALWKQNYDGLIMGHVDDGHPELVGGRLDAFRKNPPCDTCRRCAILQDGGLRR